MQMSKEATEKILLSVVAQICQYNGWNSASKYTLNILSELLERFYSEICKIIISSSELAERTLPNLQDILLAFETMGITLKDLSDYLDNVPAFPFIQSIPNSISKPNKLNFSLSNDLPEYIDEFYPPLIKQTYEDTKSIILDANDDLFLQDRSIQHDDEKHYTNKPQAKLPEFIDISHNVIIPKGVSANFQLPPIYNILETSDEEEEEEYEEIEETLETVKEIVDVSYIPIENTIKKHENFNFENDHTQLPAKRKVGRPRKYNVNEYHLGDRFDDNKFLKKNDDIRNIGYKKKRGRPSNQRKDILSQTKSSSSSDSRRKYYPIDEVIVPDDNFDDEEIPHFSTTTSQSTHFPSEKVIITTSANLIKSEILSVTSDPKISLPISQVELMPSICAITKNHITPRGILDNDTNVDNDSLIKEEFRETPPPSSGVCLSSPKPSLSSPRGESAADSCYVKDNLTDADTCPVTEEILNNPENERVVKHIKSEEGSQTALPFSPYSYVEEAPVAAKTTLSPLSSPTLITPIRGDSQEHVANINAPTETSRTHESRLLLKSTTITKVDSKKVGVKKKKKRKKDKNRHREKVDDVLLNRPIIIKEDQPNVKKEEFEAKTSPILPARLGIFAPIINTDTKSSNKQSKKQRIGVGEMFKIEKTDDDEITSSRVEIDTIATSNAATSSILLAKSPPVVPRIKIKILKESCEATVISSPYFSDSDPHHHHHHMGGEGGSNNDELEDEATTITTSSDEDNNSNFYLQPSEQSQPSIADDSDLMAASVADKMATGVIQGPPLLHRHEDYDDLGTEDEIAEKDPFPLSIKSSPTTTSKSLLLSSPLKKERNPIYTPSNSGSEDEDINVNNNEDDNDEFNSAREMEDEEMEIENDQQIIELAEEETTMQSTDSGNEQVRKLPSEMEISSETETEHLKDTTIVCQSIMADTSSAKSLSLGSDNEEATEPGSQGQTTIEDLQIITMASTHDEYEPKPRTSVVVAESQFECEQPAERASMGYGLSNFIEKPQSVPTPGHEYFDDQEENERDLNNQSNGERGGSTTTCTGGINFDGSILTNTDSLDDLDLINRKKYHRKKNRPSLSASRNPGVRGMSSQRSQQLPTKKYVGNKKPITSSHSAAISRAFATTTVTTTGTKRKKSSLVISTTTLPPSIKIEKQDDDDSSSISSHCSNPDDKDYVVKLKSSSSSHHKSLLLQHFSTLYGAGNGAHGIITSTNTAAATAVFAETSPTASAICNNDTISNAQVPTTTTPPKKMSMGNNNNNFPGPHSTNTFVKRAKTHHHHPPYVTTSVVSNNTTTEDYVLHSSETLNDDIPIDEKHVYNKTPKNLSNTTLRISPTGTTSTQVIGLLKPSNPNTKIANKLLSGTAIDFNSIAASNITKAFPPPPHHPPSISASKAGGTVERTVITETLGSINENGEKIWICPACTHPDDGSPMIGCDTCDDWYHWVCVNITEPPAENENWYCSRCLAKRIISSYSSNKKKKKKTKR